MSVNAMLVIVEEQIANYFVKKGAITEKSAIVLDLVDLKSKIEFPDLLPENILTLPFVKTTGEGKYYVDKNKLVKQTQRVKSIVFGMAIMILTAIIFGLGKYYMSTVKNQPVVDQPRLVDSNMPEPTPQVTTTPTPISTTSAATGGTHANKFISFDYPKDLYTWSYGRGVSLAYFQLNSVEEKDQDIDDKVIMSFDIQTLNYTQSKNIAEQRQSIEDLQRQNPEYNYKTSSRTVDGVPALEYIRSMADSPYYEKTIWLVKNNVKYIVTMTVLGKTEQSRDDQISKYDPKFKAIIKSIKLKDVGPADIEKSNNNPS